MLKRVSAFPYLFLLGVYHPLKFGRLALKLIFKKNHLTALILYGLLKTDEVFLNGTYLVQRPAQGEPRGSNVGYRVLIKRRVFPWIHNSPSGCGRRCAAEQENL